MSLVKEVAQDHMLQWSSWNSHQVGTGFRAAALPRPLEGSLEGMGLRSAYRRRKGPLAGATERANVWRGAQARHTRRESGKSCALGSRVRSGGRQDEVEVQRSQNAGVSTLGFPLGG